MPELPEVESVRSGLRKHILGRTIDAIKLSDKPLRLPSPNPLQQLIGSSVAKIDRHGKFLLWRFTNQSTLITHLGMTGNFRFYETRSEALPHTHVILNLDDGTEVHFTDPRRFGFFKLYHAHDDIPDLQSYGPDALSSDFTVDYLTQQLKASKQPLKNFLMDQKHIAGLGNIYVCEALWRSRLSPRRKACNTPATKVSLLHSEIIAVLNEALAVGGTSFSDFADYWGELGEFVNQLNVFQKTGQPCPRCQAIIKRITQSNRSTFYCSICQR